MILSIVIPVFNEEEAVEKVIVRCLEAKDSFLKELDIDNVEIIIVDDGSKDNTVKLASNFEQVKLIKHPKNKGYGAALLTGFESAKGDVIGFLDGDGTCDPMSFRELYKKLIEDKVDLVIGSRLTEMSSMPKLRKMGNMIFAKLINLIGNTNITDSASGMRLFRRAILPEIELLPLGLHFTPAMTSHAIFGGKIKLAEVPISYKERTGASKLNVVRDGLRFLHIILEIATLYAPFKIFGFVAMIFFAIAIVYGISPTIEYLEIRMVRENMFYRIFTVIVLIIVGLIFMSVGAICERIMYADNPAGFKKMNIGKIIKKIFFGIHLIIIGPFIALMGVVLNLPAIEEYLIAGTVSIHWSRVVVGGFLVIVGTYLFSLGIMERVIRLFVERKQLEYTD